MEIISKKNLIIIQPFLTKYRQPVFNKLSEYFNVYIICSKTDNDSYGEKFKLNNVKKIHFVKTTNLFCGKIYYQYNLINILNKIESPIIFIFANLRYISLWQLLFYCYFKKIRIYLYGHGIYKKSKIDLFTRSIYNTAINLSTKYICYTNYCKYIFEKHNFLFKNIDYVNNSLIISEKEEYKDFNWKFLFIGRLRKGSEILKTIHILSKLKSKYKSIELEIIGTGVEAKDVSDMSREYKWIKYHGAIYCNENIRNIAKNCSLGIYLGNSGLSIMHFMSLSLPPITHNEIKSHEGPEVTYIKHMHNGILLNKNNIENSLDKNLAELTDIDTYKNIKINCFKTYESLQKPDFAERLKNCIIK